MTDKQITCKCNDKECGQCSFEEQLKAKEQECEELKERLYVQAKEKVKYIFELDQLKANNEILEKDKANLEVIKETLKVQFKQLKQTLTEIKEIAEDFGFNGTYESYKTAIDQILQKISDLEV